MIRLTLRTLLAYLDDTLPPADAKVLGQKLAESEEARELADKIKKVTRKRSLSTPPTGGEGGATDPNTVAAYLSDKLTPEQVTEFEKIALESDVSLAEVAACHQILTLVLSEQVRVPPPAYRRMYALVKGKESIPGRSPGKAVPVGGAVPTEKPGEADEADVQYLLGLPAYSRSRPFGERVLRWATAAVLAVGFLVSAWLVWPAWKAKEMAQGPTTPPTTPAPEPEKKVEPEKKPEPEKKDEPMTAVEPEKKPPMPPVGELTPEKKPPKDGRVTVAKLDSPDGKVLLCRKADGDTWARVAKGGEVASSDRFVCPPGSTAKLNFETGLVLELWGNVFPDLLPVPVYETAITPHIPDDGYEADLTLHAGRVYLSTGKATGAKVRVRFRSEVWDVALPDAASEAVVQILHDLVPGAEAELPKTTAVVHTLKGSAAVKVRFKTVPVAAGEVLGWDSKGGTLDGPKKPDGQFGKDLADFNKTPIYPNSAQPMLKVIADFAERLKEAKSVAAAVAELRADPNAPPSPASFAAARFATSTAAAVGDLGVVAEALNDANRFESRSAAIPALQHRLATYPDDEEAFRKLAGTKLRLSDADTAALLRTLRGLTEAERTDKATLTALVKQLSAAEVAQREVALFVLVTQADPTDQPTHPLMFDTAAPADVREKAAKGWKDRIDKLAK